MIPAMSNLVIIWIMGNIPNIKKIINHVWRSLDGTEISLCWYLRQPQVSPSLNAISSFEPTRTRWKRRSLISLLSKTTSLRNTDVGIVTPSEHAQIDGTLIFTSTVNVDCEYWFAITRCSHCSLYEAGVLSATIRQQFNYQINQVHSVMFWMKK